MSVHVVGDPCPDCGGVVYECPAPEKAVCVHCGWEFEEGEA